MSSTLYATPRRSFIAADVHARSAGRLRLDRDHRLEPLGSRAYTAAAIWGTVYLLAKPNRIHSSNRFFKQVQETDPVMSSLRQQLRSSRRSLSHRQQQAAAEQISMLLSLDTDVITAKSIAFYLPNDGEIDCGRFMTRCQELGKQLFLPVVSEDKSQPLLLFQQFIPGTTPLVTNRYNIPEPRFNAENTIDPTKLDIVFCPLVGFDRQGNRLGMGKGYYDRTFAPKKQRLEKPLLIGLAHSIQETSLIPNPWDIPLDIIFTEKEKITPA